MSDQVSLAEIRRLARQGLIAYTRHGLSRMWERNISQGDVRHALAEAASACSQANGTHRVLGQDLDGEGLVVIVALGDEVVVVTVF